MISCKLTELPRITSISCLKYIRHIQYGRHVTRVNDTKSYAKVTKDNWTFRRQKAIETRDKLVNSYSRFLPPNSLKFLRSLDDSPRSIDPAKFYIIPKIHKSPISC